MPAHIQSLPIAFGPAYIRQATVKQVVTGEIYGVTLEGQTSGEIISARLATSLHDSLRPGDRVLVAGENPSSGYIIGRMSASADPGISTPSGAGARIQGQGRDQCISVNDSLGRTVFEYYPEQARSVLVAAQGDLQLAAPQGAISLEAAKGIHCTSAAKISFESKTDVRASVHTQERGGAQAVKLDNDGLQIRSHQLKLTAGQGEVSIARAIFQGKQYIARVSRVKLIGDRLEITARRLWERSEHSIRQVLHLCQMQAGRMRTLVKGAHHLYSDRSTIVAKEDVRIDGKKINLG